MPHRAEIVEFLTGVQDRLRTCVTEAVSEPLCAIDTDLAAYAELAMSAVTDGGKRLRPRFAFYAWRLSAPDPGPAAPSVIGLAAALELLHAAILIHDDIIDRSDLRRGKPSARAALAGTHRSGGWWGDAQEFGDGNALLVGDLLWSTAHDEFDAATSALPPEVRRDAVRGFRAMRVDVLSGQLLELRAQAVRDYRPATAEKILRFKTGSYTVVRPIELGLALAGCTPDPVAAALNRYAVAVGQAFQLRDDLADLFNSTESTGKRAGDDFRTGKPTELLGDTLALAPAADVRRLQVIVGDRAADDDAVDDARQIALRSGAVSRAHRRIAGLTATAQQALADLPPGMDRVGLAGLHDLLAECTDLSFLPPRPRVGAPH